MIPISLSDVFSHPLSKLPSALLRYFEQNLSVKKTTTFLKDLPEATHTSSHSANLFRPKLGTFRSNKAMHHQAACLGVYFHASELASPTGCWKGAKEHHLACHISSLATASQEEGLKLNGNENKIQPSDPCHCVSPTTQSTLLTQGDTDLPGRRKPVLKPTALPAGNSADPQSFIKLYASLSIEGASGTSGVSQHPSYPQNDRCF